MNIQRKIVCAANKLPDGTLLIGVRHWDNLMRAQALKHITDNYEAEQGFVNTWGEFCTRKEAWMIACANNQIIRYVGNQTMDDFGVQGTELFSENLY